MSKKDYENLARQGNRLAWMTETWVDDDDHSKGRSATLNDVGISGIMDNWRSISDNLGRGRFNKNFSLNIVSNTANLDILEEIGNTVARTASEKREYDNFIEKLKQFAGRASAEKGLNLAERSKQELTHAEDIR